MRLSSWLLSAALAPYLLGAQDAASEAARAAAAANQQALADADRAARAATEAHRQAVEDAARASQQAPAAPKVEYTAPPRISVKSGRYASPIQVKLSPVTRGSILYYTTDGWTPTTESARYAGPILIDRTTTLQAIAIAPYARRSIVASAVYTFPAASVDSDGAREPGAVRVVFAEEVSSRRAEIGDKVRLTLAGDLVIAGVVVAAKGAPASVTVTQVERTGAGGAPGELHFRIDPLETVSGRIPLRGAASLEGQVAPPNGALLIPVLGMLTLLHHGKDAVIPAGTPFTAYLDSTVAATPARPLSCNR